MIEQTVMSTCRKKEKNIDKAMWDKYCNGSEIYHYCTQCRDKKKKKKKKE